MMSTDIHEERLVMMGTDIHEEKLVMMSTDIHEERLHRKKRFASFPSPAGMSLPNSPWAGIMTS
jgi:hypothetical protein